MSYSVPTYQEAAAAFINGATTAQHHRAGAIITDAAGMRTYRYCRVGDRTLPGRMVATPKATVISSGYALASSKYVKSIGPEFGANVGDTIIKLFSAKSLTSTTFQDGFITVSEGVGQGQGTLAIKSYETGTAAKTTKIRLWDPLRHPLSTTSRLVIHANPYVNLVETSGIIMSTMVPKGVQVVGKQDGATQTCGSSGWVWIQTKGPGQCISRDGITKNETLYPSKSGGLSGRNTIQTSGNHVAVANRAAASGKYAAVELFLE